MTVVTFVILTLFVGLFLPLTNGCPFNGSTVNLSSRLSNTSEISESVFTFCNLSYGSITTIILSYNNIKTIAAGAFKEFFNLENLDLSYNLLEVIDNNTFQTLRKLKTLDLSYNSLTNITRGTLDNKVYLVSLNVSHNKISYVDSNVFSVDHINLREANFDWNEISTFEPWPYSLPSDINEDRNVYIRHNNISRFTNYMNWTYNLKLPFKIYVYLDYNQLKTISSNDIQLYNQNLTDIESFSEFLTYRLNVSNNPYVCDGRIYFWAFLVRNSFLKWNRVESYRYRCNLPKDLEGEDWLHDVPYSRLVTNLTEADGCPSRCFCQTRPYLNYTLVDCGGLGLVRFPPILPRTKYPHLVLNLSYNAIQQLEETYYSNNIVQLYLANNKIQTLNESVLMLFDNNIYLDLQNNQITRIPKSILRFEYKNVSAGGNPLKCYCEMTWMIGWIKKVVVGTNQDLSCTADDTNVHKIVDVTPSILKCTHEDWIIIGAVLGVVVVTIVIVGLFVKKCPYETKVMLFKIFKIHPRDKYKVDKQVGNIHDIYIVFDEKTIEVLKWARDIFLVKLRRIKPQYEVFNPHQHVKPGENTLGELAKNLEQSKRVIIILTEEIAKNEHREFECNFAEGEYCEKSLEGKVIYIKFNSKVDKLLQEEPWKTRVSSKKVFSPDDRLFWSKLRYELPRIKNGSNRVHRFPDIRIETTVTTGTRIQNAAFDTLSTTPVFDYIS
ncbi:hypothetical protein CHS0354_006691 [Potamilus streckersoni]|uniref:TIR domain-containing protein n=1 Tax=Potamilus streckersoni TaxID=2493646 RepID=A0AAE0W352_9BIVA|nr:hypothetical protein CHS0354_006691 [Potamilus streckersoni]